jgi:hypothetical protein
MKGRCSLVLTSLLLASCTPMSQSSSGMVGTASEWTVLFDGSTLDGWDRIGSANWRLEAEDRSVVADGGGAGFLVTQAVYDDFELAVDFWISETANSGVFIRCSDPSNVTAGNCYEINLWDTRPDPTYRTGSIVSVSPPMQQVDAGGRWNTLMIRADKDRLTLILNGITTVDTHDSRHSEGVIALQYATETSKFGNVRIRSLR